MATLLEGEKGIKMSITKFKQKKLRKMFGVYPHGSLKTRFSSSYIVIGSVI